MRSIVLSTCMLIAFLMGNAQGPDNRICRLGFDYEISNSTHWGNDRPVVTHILPYSPAEQSGLMVNDVITAIDGASVASLSDNEISQLLNQADKSNVILTVSNLTSTNKQVSVRKDCKNVNTITEDQLAAAFSMYSLESTNAREFVCPFKTITTHDAVDFANYKTFAFAPIDESNRNLETIINETIAKELIAKGMKPEANNPDVLIQTFYFFDKNPGFRGTNRIQTEKEPTFRYDYVKQQMAYFPFLSSNTPESEAEYLLQLGFRLVDQKEQAGRVLWECEANELMDNSYRLDEYAKTHIPLMCMQYPYVKYSQNVKFAVDQKMYNYTGIGYDIDRLDVVSEVAPNSPAAAAGVRAGDKIEKINQYKMVSSAEDFSKAYKRFVKNTMKYRDRNIQYTDANGFRYSMHWDNSKYSDVANVVQNPKSLAAFSYLYYFTPYINPSGTNTTTFSLKRGDETTDVIIRPTVHKELSVRVD
ncbi:MAG: PDZ domain-containing protein [Tannerellaceae bacterium]|nr:PDZ domain-containing protein [Tannerellaceae bacterium]